MSEVEIDKLIIEVSSDTKSATEGFKALRASLSRLEKQLELTSPKVLTFSQNVSALKRATSGLSLGELSKLNDFKIFPSATKNFRSLVDSVNSLNGSQVAHFRRLGNSLGQFTAFKLSKSSITQLLRMPEVLKAFEKLNTSRFAAQMRELNSSLSPLTQSVDRLATAYSRLPRSLRTAAAAARTVVSTNRVLASSTTAAAGSASLLGGGLVAKYGMLVSAAYMGSRFFDSTVGRVNEYIENMNLFEASMGSATQEATEFGIKVQNALGIDFGEWARNQGVFQTLITGMGDTAERANVMSQQLTQLGYDIASFYNISVEDAMLKLQSGMAGELEPLRRLGWDLSNARMQIEATKLGIEGNVSAMSQAEKVGLRYYLIMNQVTQTHGDMARTIASPANQLRVLQAQVTLTARAIGNLFIPALNAILPVVIAVVKAVRILAQSIADFFGIDATFEVDYSGLDTSGITSGVDDVTDSIDDSGSAADKAKKKIKEYQNTVMGFDELNKLNPENEDNSGTGSNGKGGAAGAGGGLDLPLDTYDFLAGLTDAIGKKTDEMARKLADAFKTVLPIVAGIGAGIAAWKLGNKLLDGFERIKHINDLVKGSNFLSGVSNAFGGLGGAAGKLGLIAAAIALCAVHFTNLWINSESFRRGIKAIWDTISGWPEAIGEFLAGVPGLLSGWFEPIVSFFKNTFNIDLTPLKNGLDVALGAVGTWWSTVSEIYDFQWTDLLMLAGIAITAFLCPPLAVALGAVEAVSLAIRAIGWAVSPCAEQVEVLADVSEETAAKFGTSIDSMQGAIQELDRIDFADTVVTEEDVSNIGAKITDIHDTILSNLDAKRNEELADIDALAGICDDESVQAMKNRVNASYDEQAAAVEGGSARIMEIYSQAAAENRDLEDWEAEEIRTIQAALQEDLLESSGASAEELESIQRNLANNNEAIALEQAQEVMQSAIAERDARVRAAWDSYDNQMAAAQAALEAGDITQEQYDNIAQAALNTAQTEQDAANDAYYGEGGVVATIEEGLGDASDKIDTETGTIKTNWDIFCEDVNEAWSGFCEDVGGWYDEHIQPTFDDIQQLATDLGESWDTFCSDVSEAWEGLCNDVTTWYNDTLKPFFDAVGTGAQIVGDTIGRFLSDPVGTLKQAWAGVCSWFDINVATPIKRAFESVANGIKGAINWAIGKLNGFNFKVPGPLQGIVGSKSIGFNIPYLATGGFVDSGQLFVARESGAEMVGTFGGRTTVANNQQIVEGIESGVYNAVVKALVSTTSNDGNKTIEIPLIIGEKEIARATYTGLNSMVRTGEIKAAFV